MRRTRSSLAGTVLATLAVVASLWCGTPVVIPVIAGLILAKPIPAIVRWLDALVSRQFVSTNLGRVCAVGSCLPAWRPTPAGH